VGGYAVESNTSVSAWLGEVVGGYAVESNKWCFRLAWWSCGLVLGRMHRIKKACSFLGASFNLV